MSDYDQIEMDAFDADMAESLEEGDDPAPLIPISIKDIQRGNQVAMWDFADRLDRRYTFAVRQVAQALGITPGRTSKRDLIDLAAAALATGDFPHVVVQFRLHD